MLEAAVAVGVGVVCLGAAIAVVRARVPTALRVVAILVLLYGASVVATVANGGFAAALDGAPLPVLPYWLRAAYLDGELILPAIALVAVVAAVVLLARRRAAGALTAFVLGLAALGCAQIAAFGAGARALPTIVAFERPAPKALAGAPCPDPTANPLAGIEGYAPGAGGANQIGGGLGGMLGGGGNAAANATPKPTPAPVVTCTVDPNVVGFFARVHELDAKLPQDAARVPALAASLGTADAAYAYVRDRIATERYPGAMRGALGTLVARGGSSADKALLLAALLQAQKIPVRFAFATLSDAEVASLAQAPAPPPDPGDSADGALDAQARATTAKLQAAESAAIDAAVTSAAPLVDDLLARVASSGTALGGASPASASVRTHYWVQAQSNGAWTDLDPALPSSAKGAHLGANPSTSDVLPDDAYVTLAIRVFADRVGAASTAPVADVSKRVADLAGTPVIISLADRNAKLKDAASVQNVTATVTAAGTDTSSDSMALAGLQTVRYELTMTQPGRAARVYRRTLFRATSSDARVVAADATVADTLLVTAGDYDGAFVDRREVDDLRAAEPLLIWATEHRTGPVPLPPANAGEPFPIEVLRYAVADARVRARLAATVAPQARFVYDRPTLALVRRGFHAEPNRLRGHIEFDVVDNGMLVLGGDTQRALRANALRGALDANVEQHVIGASTPGGTRALFDAAKSAGVAEVVVTPGPGDRTAAVALDADARAHLNDTLALHEVAVVPQHAVAMSGAQRDGWWAFDPASGDLVGRMEDGAGQGEVEYVLARLNDDATLYAMIQFYGDFFRCIAMGVEAPLVGDNAKVQQCMSLSLCNYLESLTFGFGIDNTMLAFVYTLLDITFYANTPGLSWKQNSAAPGGAACKHEFDPNGTFSFH